MEEPRETRGNFGFAFNDVDFSDRVLHVEIRAEFLDSRTTHDGGDCVSNRKRRRENLERDNGEEVDESSDSNCSTNVEVKTYHISSPILAEKSPFFYKLFKNGMRESQQKNATLRINPSEEAALMDLMKFMYSNTLSATTTSDLLDVLMVADKFEVTSCMNYCIRLLFNKLDSVDSALLFLELPSDVQLLIDAAKEYLVVHFRNFTKTQEEAMSLPLCALEIVLLSVGLQVVSEDAVFDFILKWARRHYPKREERREILTKRLLSFLWFPYMSCRKLKKVLVYPDLHDDTVSGRVFHALICKLEDPYGKHIHDSKDPASPNYGVFERVYKYRFIKVVPFDSPLPRCVVFFDLKKGDCANLSQGQLISEIFCIGRQRCFLLVQCSKLTSSDHFGLWLSILPSPEVSATCTLDCEFSVMKSLSQNFKSIYKMSDPRPLKDVKFLGKPNMFGIPWSTFMADNSEYFVNGILHLRAELIMKNANP